MYALYNSATDVMSKKGLFKLDDMFAIYICRALVAVELIEERLPSCLARSIFLYVHEKMK